ncbi:MAG: hypothetical protein M3Z09_17850 [Acidobacteriota bacterium]|nr:hypothetical protein [Acidobacteriota bacterium]
MRQSELDRFSVWKFPVAAVLLVASWQWATVTANYSGNWTALFCTGALQQHPPLVVSERVYLFANSAGYDGQIYHYIAHDPFMRSGLKSYVDEPRLRYRRILVPLLAYGLAGGRPDRVDPAYELVFLVSIGLGVYWSCRFAQSVKLTRAWGLLFLAMPAIPITMDRLVIDGGLAALTAAFVYYSRSPSWKLFVVLMCAALTRETGFLLVVAYCLHMMWRRRFRIAGVFALSAVPAAAWYGYVQARTTGHSYGLSLMPFSAILQVLRNPWRYPPGTPFGDAVRMADYLALAGVLLGFGFALLWFARRGPSAPPRMAAVLFTAVALVMQRTDHWLNVYDFGRVYTPMLICLSAAAAQYRKLWLLTPVAMMMPRLAIQLAPQVLGVIRWGA